VYAGHWRAAPLRARFGVRWASGYSWTVFVTGFPAGPWGTNCYVAASGPRSECIIVDPGMDAVKPLQDVIAEHHLRPVAVLLSHGHLDHTWSVVPVANGYGIPAYLHGDDRSMLSDPEGSLGPETKQVLRQLVPDGTLDLEPDDVRLLSDHEQLSLADIDLTAGHAPGHTPGSTVFTRPAVGDVPPIMFAGDVLFAGSIGRTDLPGGDHAAMMRSLRDVILPMDDDMVVLPGHGPQTTIGQERATNPFLLELSDLPLPPRKGM
jgi:hydroxyacylglutathione hydrolase